MPILIISIIGKFPGELIFYTLLANEWSPPMRQLADISSAVLFSRWRRTNFTFQDLNMYSISNTTDLNKRSHRCLLLLIIIIIKRQFIRRSNMSHTRAPCSSKMNFYSFPSPPRLHFSQCLPLIQPEAHGPLWTKHKWLHLTSAWKYLDHFTNYDVYMIFEAKNIKKKIIHRNHWLVGPRNGKVGELVPFRCLVPHDRCTIA